MVRVNAEVSKEKREKWKEYAQEEPNADGNLSRLIRYSVEKEIARDESPDNGANEEVLTKIGELGTQLSEISERIGSLEARMSRVEEMAREEPEIGEVTGELFDLLPQIEPGTEEWKRKDRDLHQELEHTESESIRQKYLGWNGTVDSLSEALDESEYVVRKALEKLQTDTHLVRSTEHDGETRFYKVE